MFRGEIGASIKALVGALSAEGGWIGLEDDRSIIVRVALGECGFSPVAEGDGITPLRDVVY